MVAPTAVVNTLEWASSKTVTITYPIGFNNYYKINNGEWIKVEENSINIPVTVSETEIFARTYDNVNYSGSESITVSKIDTKTPEVPTITSSDSIATNNWHTNTFTLNYSGSTSVSGITYYYGTNTNNMTSIGASETLSTSTNGTTYYVKACNGAGTCSGNTSYVVKLEMETPSAPTLTGGSTDYATTRTISISNQSSATSGIARYEYYISTSSSTQTGGEWTTGNSITDTTNGISYIYIRAISNAGKTGTVSAYQATYIDTNKPTISIKESGSSTITEEDSNPILTTYFNYSANGDASISNTSCIDTVIVMLM